MDKLFIHGNVGTQPEMRFMPNGRAVTNFTVAANRRWSDSEGKRQELTVWYRCAAFGGRAEVIADHVNKRDGIVIEGQLRADPETGGPRIWTGKDGEPRASFEVTVLDFDFGERASDRDGGSEPTQAEPEDEIPF